MKTTLAIIGSHPRTRALFDFDRTDCDIWLFNEAARQPWAKRYDAVFQLHNPIIWRNPVNRNDPQHYDWLKSQTEAVVYMQEVYPDVPASKAYPLQGIRDMLGGSDNHFLTSSVPQAMAMAAYLGTYDRIEIYGVAMETSTEYQFQREGVSFWLGFLQGRGIDVYFAETTFQIPVYGYEGEVVIDYHRFEERIAELEPQIENLKKEYIGLHLNAINTFKAFFEDDGSKMNEENIYKSVAVLLEVGERIGRLNGANAENKRYKARADAMKNRSGDFIFSRQEFESAAAKTKEAHAQAHTAFISIGTTLAHVQRNAAQAAKGSKKRAGLFTLLLETLERYLKAHAEMEIFRGAAQENYNYMIFLDQHIRAAGGAKSEAVLLEAMQNA
jgi:hypothetical protein